jgi:hypothetical protein
VDIREALGGAAGYSHSEGKQQEAQQHLWSIACRYGNRAGIDTNRSANWPPS